MADFAQEIRQAMGKAFGELKRQHDQMRAIGGEHALIRQELQRQQNEMRQLAGIMSGVSMGGGRGAADSQVSLNNDDRIMYIDQIPGRRVPFDLLVEIPIGANVNSEQQQSTTISQDGPFVAVARYAYFQSAHRFSVLVDGRRVDFVGRTNGRFRPIHSMCDWTDAQAFQPTVGLANPGTGGPIVASPSNHSGFRSMEFDGYVEFLNQGSGYFRGNRPVPTAFYTSEQNTAFQLGSFDFFERGESLQWKVTPGHINNPAAGNVGGFLGAGIFPALDSQYDVHEGVLDEFDPQASEDPVSRIPDGILGIGFHGFRIIQPPGPVRMT
jgi:hypothetical protein